MNNSTRTILELVSRSSVLSVPDLRVLTLIHPDLKVPGEELLKRRSKDHQGYYYIHASGRRMYHGLVKLYNSSDGFSTAQFRDGNVHGEYIQYSRNARVPSDYSRNASCKDHEHCNPKELKMIRKILYFESLPVVAEHYSCYDGKVTLRNHLAGTKTVMCDLKETLDSCPVCNEWKQKVIRYQ